MDLLATLTQTPSVPGREARVREVIENHVRQAGLFDEIRTDAMGSLIGIRRPRPKDGGTIEKPLKVMLAAHMDQIGFLVSHIDENGFLRVNPVGGFDARNLFARQVRVCTAGGDLPGVMNPSGRPIHIATADEKTKVPEINEFFIDIGMTGETVKERVKIGDMVVLDGRSRKWGTRSFRSVWTTASAAGPRFGLSKSSSITTARFTPHGPCRKKSDSAVRCRLHTTLPPTWGSRAIQRSAARSPACRTNSG